MQRRPRGPKIGAKVLHNPSHGPTPLVHKSLPDPTPPGETLDVQPNDQNENGVVEVHNRITRGSTAPATHAPVCHTYCPLAQRFHKHCIALHCIACIALQVLCQTSPPLYFSLPMRQAQASDPAYCPPNTLHHATAAAVTPTMHHSHTVSSASATPPYTPNYHKHWPGAARALACTPCVPVTSSRRWAPLPDGVNHTAKALVL